MSTITVVDVMGDAHRFQDVEGVEIQDDGSIDVVATNDPRKVAGAFATGRWSSWRRLADDPTAPAHKTHVHFADRAIDLVE